MTSKVILPPKPQIEILLETALVGEEEAIRAFLYGFLDTSFLVPERFQKHPLSDAPLYPDELVNILGVQEADRVYVPIFSSEAQMNDWSGDQLQVRQLTGFQLLEILPDEWWISLNPAGTSGKEFSPWELRELRNGSEGIAAVLQEILEGEEKQPARISFINEAEFPALCDSLRNFGQSEQDVEAVYLLGEESEGEHSSSPTLTICIGIQTNADLPSRLSTLQDAAAILARQSFLGDDQLQCKVFVGKDPEQSMALALFRNTTPLFDKNGGGILSHVRRFFRPKK